MVVTAASAAQSRRPVVVVVAVEAPAVMALWSAAVPLPLATLVRSMAATAETAAPPLTARGDLATTAAMASSSQAAVPSSIPAVSSPATVARPVQAAGETGSPERGGIGVVGANLMVINSGSISGGLTGDGSTRASAIQFTSGSNVLELQAGSTITGAVVGGGLDTLQLGGTINSTFDVSAVATQYTGFGTFVKTGTSTWTLTGTLTGTTTQSTPWTIDQGTLAVSSDANLGLPSGVTFNGGTLQFLAALSSSRTVTLNAGGGSFDTESNDVTLSGAIGGTGSLTKIGSGTLTLSGGNTYGGGTAVDGGTLQLSGAGTLGATTGTTTVNSGGTPSISYNANNAYLNLSLNYTPGPGPTSPNFGGGLSGNNQQAVANALINSFNSNAGIPMVFGALSAAGLTQASGELATGSQQTTFDAMSQFMGLLTDPFLQRNGGVGSASGAVGFAEEENASSYAANRRTDAFAMFTKAPLANTYDPRWGVWAAGFGGAQSTDGNASLGSSNTTSSIAGTVVGADYRFSPFTIAGFALAGGGTSFSVAGSGGGRSDLFQAGAYIRHDAGAAYITGALAYGWQDIITNRTVTLAGTDMLRAEFNANAFSGRVEGGYRFVAPWVGGIGITPYAAAQFTTFDLPAYAETALAGSGAFALSYGAKSVTDPRSELGFRTDKSYAMPDGVLTLRGRLAWAHDYDTDRSIAATFQTLPGASFTVNGAAQASDSVLTTASIERKWINNWSIAATFEGEFSGVTESYAGKGVVRYQW
jgi:autotransporter-associated beta strand protein